MRVSLLPQAFLNILRIINLIRRFIFRKRKFPPDLKFELWIKKRKNDLPMLLYDKLPMRKEELDPEYSSAVPMYILFDTKLVI